MNIKVPLPLVPQMFPVFVLKMTVMVSNLHSENVKLLELEQKNLGLDRTKQKTELDTF